MSHHRPSPNRLPEKIYVRRRVAAVVAALVVIGLVIWALSAAGKSDHKDGQDPAAVARPSSSGERPTSATAPYEATAPSSAPASQDPKPQCQLSDLRVSAQTDQPSYAGGAQPTLYMTVENPTGADCTIDLDRDVMRFEVYNMASNQRVWSDVDCYKPTLTGKQKFEKNNKRSFEVQWSRTGSAPKQCKDRQPVPGGSYYLHAVVGNNASQPATFNLG